VCCSVLSLCDATKYHVCMLWSLMHKHSETQAVFVNIRTQKRLSYARASTHALSSTYTRIHTQTHSLSHTQMHANTQHTHNSHTHHSSPTCTHTRNTTHNTTHYPACENMGGVIARERVRTMGTHVSAAGPACGCISGNSSL